MAALLLVACALGLSNFAAAIGIGLAERRRFVRLRVAVLFGLFEAGMPLLGLVLGRVLAEQVQIDGRYLGAALLAIVGAYTLISAMRARRGSSPRAENALGLPALTASSAALSIDNLVAGLALGVYRVPLVAAVLVIGAVSVAMALVGLELGSRLGGRLEKYSGEIAGLVLIGVACALLAGLV